MSNSYINNNIVLTNSYDIGTIEYNSFLTTPLSASRLRIVDTLVRALKYSGNWTLIDRLWLFASETQQGAQISLVNPSSTAITEVNAPAWVANQGYTSNGTTSYLNSNINIATGTVQYTQNNACIGLYSRSNVAEDLYDMGVFDGGTTRRAQIISRSLTDTMNAALNSNTNSTMANTSSSGLMISARTASDLTTFYRNAVSLGTINAASASISSYNLFVLCLNATGSATGYSTKQISMSLIGAGSINQLSLYNSIQAYMLSIGSAV